MGNDVFVTAEDSFELSAYYTKEDGNFLVYGEDSLPKDFVADVGDDEEDEGAEEKKKYTKISVEFRLPDWEMSRQIMNQSVMQVGAQQLLDPRTFKNALFDALAIGWNLEKDGKPLGFSYEMLLTLRPDIARCFIDMLEQKLIEKGVYDSMLQS